MKHFFIAPFCTIKKKMHYFLQASLEPSILAHRDKSQTVTLRIRLPCNSAQVWCIAARACHKDSWHKCIESIYILYHSEKPDQNPWELFVCLVSLKPNYPYISGLPTWETLSWASGKEYSTFEISAAREPGTSCTWKPSSETNDACRTCSDL